MAQNYFQCLRCGALDLLTYKAADVGAEGWPPRCESCEQPMVLAPQPGDFAMDARSDGGTDRSFQKFTVDVDGRPTVIDSLHTLRRVERESEQRYRNGEGEPLRFRMWSQDHTNKDVGAFGAAGKIGERTYDSGAPAPQKKPAKVGVRRHGTQKPRVRVVPGAGQSPL